jgi:histidine triad (HIT) family protein
VADCIFCRIAAGEVPAQILYSDERVVAFADARPQAPTHVLVVPRAHYASLADVPAGQEGLLGHLLGTCRDLGARLGLERGHRVVVNTGPFGGQTVDHLHLHLLGGRAMAWPPG